MIKKVLILFGFVVFATISSSAQDQVYEIREYKLEVFRSSDVLHQYFKEALLPALNRQGAENVGVFEEMGESLPKTIYLIISHKDIGAFQKSSSELFEDEAYTKAAAPYLSADQATIPFLKISSKLIQSTKEFPELMVPKNAGFYELRIYQSHNEATLKSKLRMFEDEFTIFADAGLPMVFYGKNLTGNHMPSLTYLLANSDKEENSTGWSNFVNHPGWKKLISMEEYKGNMSDIVRVFLKPLDYSQF